MIKRVTVQEIVWVDVEDRIFDENTEIKWYFLGILMRTKCLTVTQTMPNGEKSKIGFGSNNKS